MPNKSSPHGAAIVAGTVSHGTLRPQDLLRAFAATLRNVFPFNGAKLASDAEQAADDLDTNPESTAVQDAANDILGELFEQLDTIAGREGMAFCAHEGDGSDFGFWDLDGED